MCITTQKQVCSNCISEHYLSDYILHNGHSGICSYCGEDKSVLALTDIGTIIKDGFIRRYGILTQETMHDKIQTDSIVHGAKNFKNTSDLLIDEHVSSNLNLLNDLSTILGRHEGFDNADYEVSESERNWNTWKGFVDTVKHKMRYIFMDVKHPLAPVFAHEKVIDALKNAVNLFQTLDLYTSLPVGTIIYRGRPKDCSIPEDAGGMGSAPEDKSLANRFSPAGISRFYGAAAPETCLVEIGYCEPVVMGKWEVREDMEVLDLTKKFQFDGQKYTYSEMPSIFDPQYQEKFDAYTFVLAFATYISRPVNKNREDAKTIEYVPTQIVAEYLKANRPSLMGICSYSSANGGKNYTLFLDHDDCACEKMLKLIEPKTFYPVWKEINQ